MPTAEGRSESVWHTCKAALMARTLCSWSSPCVQQSYKAGTQLNQNLSWKYNLASSFQPICDVMIWSKSPNWLECINLNRVILMQYLKDFTKLDSEKRPILKFLHSPQMCQLQICQVIFLWNTCIAIYMEKFEPGQGENVLRVRASNDSWIKWKNNNISQPNSRWVSVLLTEDIHPNHNQMGYTQQNKKQNQLNSAAAEKWNSHVSQMSEKSLKWRWPFSQNVSFLFFSYTMQQTMTNYLKRAHDSFPASHNKQWALTWKEHMSVSSTDIMPPALSNSPQ